ncbi:hypothetical protein [Yersinia alsatica]|uniref:hypothetical protein n=1 Tax=Yersinia alsatica TaxID=2890317 RepID=UPI0011A2C421|nr:hypothetical protein [Yersinia alsatica]
MNEKPILFNAEMVNAILSGRKTQTRRIIANAGADNCIPLQKRTKTKDGIYTHVMDAPAYGLCPLGKPGDQLWVRECFSDLDDFEFFDPSVPDVISGYWYWADGNPEWGNWTKPKPSIHMPRAASRINLKITGVRVERLQDISDLDCCDEGYDGPAVTADNQWPSINWYERLWDSIYGKKEGENWQANPWVWVIEFERMEAK